MEIPLRNEAKRTKEATEKKVVHPKSMAELQKLKIDKLMKKPDKPVYIPEPKKEWKPREAPEFVRDVMGSSAGAGSGEFHVYRHIRRREFAREEYLNKSEKKQRLDSDFQEKLQANKDKAEQATAKRRAKRLRRKQKLLYHKKKQQKQKDEEEHKDSSDNEDETEENAGDDAEEQSFVMGGK